MTKEKTYGIEERKNRIIISDYFYDITFLLILGNDDKPKDPWVGRCVSEISINGRTLREARVVAKNYLAIKYGKDKKGEEDDSGVIPYWKKPPFD